MKRRVSSVFVLIGLMYASVQAAVILETGLRVDAGSRSFQDVGSLFLETSGSEVRFELWLHGANPKEDHLRFNDFLGEDHLLNLGTGSLEVLSCPDLFPSNPFLGDVVNSEIPAGPTCDAFITWKVYRGVVENTNFAAFLENDPTHWISFQIESGSTVDQQRFAYGSLSQVPEPTTFVFVFLGCGLIGKRRRTK